MPIVRACSLRRLLIETLLPIVPLLAIYHYTEYNNLSIILDWKKLRDSRLLELCLLPCIYAVVACLFLADWPQWTFALLLELLVVPYPYWKVFRVQYCCPAWFANSRHTIVTLETNWCHIFRFPDCLQPDNSSVPFIKVTTHQWACGQCIWWVFHASYYLQASSIDKVKTACLKTLLKKHCFCLPHFFSGHTP